MHDNYFERYTNGEEEAVWAELLALGPKVRDTPYLPQAMAVCREMTRRSRLNLRLLINRLSELDHQFWCYMLQTSPHLARLRKDDFAQWEPCIWIQPKPGVSDILDKAEKNGITLPLALRVWMEEIGLVSLSGSHPALCPFYSSWEHPNLNFSIGLRYHPNDGRPEITLLRCNGQHGIYNGSQSFTSDHPHFDCHHLGGVKPPPLGGGFS